MTIDLASNAEVRAALERHEPKLLKKIQRAEREQSKPLSIVEQALADTVNGRDGKPLVAMSYLERMSALDLQELENRDLSLYRRSLAAVLGPELVVTR